jgi:hypothetical protein
MADPIRTLICKSKKSYSTKDKADNFARQLRNDRDIIQRSYHCPVCHKWHLTGHKEWKPKKNKPGRPDKIYNHE